MPERTHTIDRATFLGRAGAAFTMAFIGRSGIARLFPPAFTLEHPEPRDGITAERVLAADALGASRTAKVVDAYDAARSYPAMFDGIACACSCGGKKGMHRSLLVCFETMQPTGCAACQEEAEIVGRLARAGKPLADIRAAVDKQFG